MSIKKVMLFSTVTAIAAGGMVFANKTEAAAPAGKEKCYGVAKAGKNDCGSLDGAHSCAGQAKKDADKNEWVLLPEGTCDKIVGGMSAEEAKAS